MNMGRDLLESKSESGQCVTNLMNLNFFLGGMT